MLKKPVNNTPYAEAIKPNQEFQSQVFGQEKGVFKKPDTSLTNIGNICSTLIFFLIYNFNEFHVSSLRKQDGKTMIQVRFT